MTFKGWFIPIQFYIFIKYRPGETGVKSEKFKNQTLNTDYYVFELDQNDKPIKASDGEATINSMQYKVVYKNETDSTKTNNAKVGETVTVTNKSRTKYYLQQVVWEPWFTGY